MLRILRYALFSALCLSATALPAAPFGLRHVERPAGDRCPIAHTQVWDIADDGRDGSRLYFATNDGLGIFDGVRWICRRPAGNTVLRALRYDETSGRLYSAGVNEFGYWTRDAYGREQYTTLLHNPDFRSRSNDFWRIGFEHCSGRYFFQCREKICIYTPQTGTIDELRPERIFRYLYEVDGHIWFQDGETLFRLGDDGRRERICEVKGRIIDLIAVDSGSLLAAVEHLGMLRIGADGSVSEADAAVNRRLAEARITCCRRYDDDLLLVGTTRRGLFVLDNEGRISPTIRCGAQLEHATILRAAPDRRGDIWLGLDSGVASIDNSTQDYYVTDNRLGQVHSLLDWDDERLLVGTNKGLFVVPDPGFAGGGIFAPSLVDGSLGPVWGIERIDGRIYVLHDRGLFELTAARTLRPVLTGSGVYAIQPCRSARTAFVMSTYTGFRLLRGGGGEGLQAVGPIRNYSGYARDFRIDERDRIWVTVLGVGFVRLTLSSELTEVVDVRSFDLAEHPSARVFTALIDQELHFCCDDRAWRIDYATDSLVRAPNAEQILARCSRGVTSLTQQGNRFWYVTAEGCGYVERNGTSLVRYDGMLEQAGRERISSHFRIVGSAATLGFSNGIGLSYGGTALPQPLEIGMVTAQSPTEIRYRRQDESLFRIPASMNTLRIWLVHLPPGRLIEYRIPSLGGAWRTERIDESLQVPALPSGRHRIELQVPGNTEPSQRCVLEVAVSPPWYVSWPMILLYVVAIGLALEGVRVYYLRKNRQARIELLRQEEQRREQELARLERENLMKEKRIAELERERLKSDLRDNNKRLANITMNTIRHNNMLNQLKGEIMELTTPDGAARLKSITGRLIRHINQQLKADSDWHLSESYFNMIYDGLLDRLRTRYPGLSQTDLRMCVYIKLNLSTKETAELMNISPRSVEMARYRLRKKLGLAPTDSIGSVLE